MLSLLIIVLILTIVFFQAVHGLFSSLIMAVCTLVCTLLAFNAYEPLVELFKLNDRIPGYAEGVMLIALLVIPLFGVRFAVDNYLPGNVVPNMWVDRVGGGVFGLITALLRVGTLVIALQMLPFDRSLLGYDPYDDSLQPADGLPIDAPAFTLAVVEKLSAGSMGGRPFTDVHGDLTLEMWAMRNRQTGARNDCPPGVVVLKHVTDVTDLPYPPGDDEQLKFSNAAPEHPGVDSADSQVFVVRIEVQDTARDVDDWWRLRGTHLRLVAADGKAYFPVAYLVFAGEWQVIRNEIGLLQAARQWTRQTPNLTADFVFRVPYEAERRPRKLSHLEFRRSCLVDLSTTKVKKAEDLAALPVAKALQRKETYGEVAVNSVHAPFVLKPIKAVVNSGLPAGFARLMTGRNAQPSTKVTRSAGGARIDVSLERGNLKSGLVTGPTDALFDLPGASRNQIVAVGAFHQPRGRRMVKLIGAPLSGTSLPGVPVGQMQKLNPRAIVQAQVFLAGQPPLPVSGAWVKFTKNGASHVHYCYSATPRDFEDFMAFPDQKIIDVIRTYYDNRKNVSEVGLIFLVPDSAKVTGFRAAATERLMCESPLSMERAPRR